MVGGLEVEGCSGWLGGIVVGVVSFCEGGMGDGGFSV